MQHSYKYTTALFSASSDAGLMSNNNNAASALSPHQNSPNSCRTPVNGKSSDKNANAANGNKWTKPVHCKSTLRLTKWPSTSTREDIRNLIIPSEVEPISIRELEQPQENQKQYFIECATERDAEKLKQFLRMNNTELEITLEKGVVKDLTNVYVTNLPPVETGFDLEKLRDLFSEFGQIISAKLINSENLQPSNMTQSNSVDNNSSVFVPNGIAFVRFSKRIEADKAIAAVNSRKIILHNSKPLECKYANKNVRLQTQGKDSTESESPNAVYIFPTFPMDVSQSLGAGSQFSGYPMPPGAHNTGYAPTGFTALSPAAASPNPFYAPYPLALPSQVNNNALPLKVDGSTNPANYMTGAALPYVTAPQVAAAGFSHLSMPDISVQYQQRQGIFNSPALDYSAIYEANASNFSRSLFPGYQLLPHQPLVPMSSFPALHLPVTHS